MARNGILVSQCCRFCAKTLTVDNIYPSCVKNAMWICIECYSYNNKEKYDPIKSKVDNQIYGQECRDKVIQALGNQCQCCKVSDIKFLTIDHINNDGAEERRKISGSMRGGGGWQAGYQMLKENNFDPQRYRMLCWNCNMCRSFHGYCQHDIIGSENCNFCGIELLNNQFDFHEFGNISVCRSCVMSIKNNTCEIRHKKYKLKVRRKLIEGYGGECANCFDDHWCFLSIDHVNGGGRKHREECRSNGVYLDRNIIINNFPPQYQLLCYNCNCGKDRG